MSMGRKLGTLLGLDGSVKAEKLPSGGGSGGVTVYADLIALSAVVGTAGDMALVQDINKMFVYTGTGWFVIATVTNAAPSPIANVSNAYALDTTAGTATVITASSTDPEGLPLTWSYSVTSGSLGSTATVSQVDNVFTITPSIDDTQGGEFSITFSVTDGANGLVTKVTQFVLDFNSYKWHFGTANTLSTAPAYFHVETTNTLDQNLGQEWTVETFVNFTSLTDYTNNINFIMSSTTGFGAFYNNWWFGVVGGFFKMGVETASVVSSIPAVIDTWYHLAVSKTSTHTYFYVDGILAHTHVGSWGSSSAHNGISIGTYLPIQSGLGWAEKYGLSAYIKEMRMIGGTALYDGSNFTTPTAHPIVSGTVAALAYEGILEDASNTSKVLQTWGTFESSSNAVAGFLDFSYPEANTTIDNYSHIVSFPGPGSGSPSWVFDGTQLVMQQNGSYDVGFYRPFNCISGTTYTFTLDIANFPSGKRTIFRIYDDVPGVASGSDITGEILAAGTSSRTWTANFTGTAYVMWRSVTTNTVGTYYINSFDISPY